MNKMSYPFITLLLIITPEGDSNLFFGLQRSLARSVRIGYLKACLIKSGKFSFLC